MKWFRLYTEILDDPKIQRLSDSEFRDFIYLMCVACEVEKNGSIPLSSEDIAWRIRRDHNSLLLSIKTLKRFHVTVSCNANETLMKHSNETHNETLHNDGIHFINWNKRQFKRDNSSERVRRYRDKKKHETPCNGYMKRDVTPLEQNRDRDRIEKPPYISPPLGQFQNIKLTEKELQKLTDNFGEINAKEKIEILSEYISSKGKKYHSHYATILSWARKDGWKKEQPKKRNVFLEGPEDGN